MPKSPIQARTTFFSTNRIDKSLRHLQFNLVDTGVGICVEPRNLLMTETQKVVDIDVYDNGITRIEMMDGDQFFSTYGTGGEQISNDFSPQA